MNFILLPYTMLRLLAWDRRSPANDLPDHDFTSPGNTNKHVVVVMDGMTEFTTEPLQWALDNVVTAECTVTLLGVMPWLNIPCESNLVILVIIGLAISAGNTV